MQKVIGKNERLEESFVAEENGLDVDLNESMWNNRKTLLRNLPRNNLTQIIEMHKSKNFNDLTKNVENEKNQQFEANLSKVKTKF